VQFFTGLRDYNGTYHNHKETLAWASIAVYLAVAVQVGLSKTRGPEAAIAIFLLTLVLLAYARRQFNLRLYAADVDWAVQRLCARALAGELDHVDPGDLAPGPPIPHAPDSGPDSSHTPIGAVLRRVFPPRYQPDEINTDVAPRVLIRELALLTEMEQRSARARAAQLENAAYLLVGCVGLAMVLMVLTR
jgi:hypothetical protein